MSDSYENIVPPIRCITCGKVLGALWDKYLKEISDKRIEEEVEQRAKRVKLGKILDKLGIIRDCCRTTMIAPPQTLPMEKYMKEISLLASPGTYIESRFGIVDRFPQLNTNQYVSSVSCPLDPISAGRAKVKTAEIPYVDPRKKKREEEAEKKAVRDLQNLQLGEEKVALPLRPIKEDIRLEDILEDEDTILKNNRKTDIMIPPSISLPLKRDEIIALYGKEEGEFILSREGSSMRLYRGR